MSRGAGAVTVGVPTGLDDFLELWRQGDVETLTALLAQASCTLATGNVIAAVARAKAGGTYTKVGFTVSATFTGATDLRVAVWAATLSGGVVTLGAKQAETANLGALAGAAYRTTALGSSVVAKPGDVFVVGIGAVGNSAGQVRGVTLSPLDATNHPLIWGGTGYAGGALGNPTQGGSGTGSIPRLMLLP